MYPLNLFILLVVVILPISMSVSTLKVDFYKQSCPSVQNVIRRVVDKTIVKNPGLGAGIIRLHFHDCFIRGCDASILLDSNIDGSPTEKANPINNSTRGYEVIDEAKTSLEKMCPDTVSCSDILAFAARDASAILGGIDYEVVSGRRDGLVSPFREVFGLPAPSDNLTSLQQKFSNKGMKPDDLVVLSGAHSIGVSHCRSFDRRIRSPNETETNDPTMDAQFAATLREICPTNDNTTVVPMDFISPNKLDSAYYHNIRTHRAMFTSDQTLVDSTNTKKMVNHYAAHGGAWKKKFGEAMVKMGLIEVLVGDEGEIRKNCRLRNEA